jgi:UDP-2-acetamido-3-amino-2,3-dideoxy-glucuronate N-acetyltransferase
MAENKELELTGSMRVHPTSIIEDGITFGNDVVIWRWSHICKGAVIGSNVMIGERVHIGPNVTIGNNVRIQNGVDIFEGAILEDDVFVGPHVCFTNIRKPRVTKPNKSYLKTVIRRGASIGANATIVCGIEVGENSMVGAGCVVHKTIPSNVTVVGNPARIIKQPKITL